MVGRARSASTVLLLLSLCVKSAAAQQVEEAITVRATRAPDQCLPEPAPRGPQGLHQEDVVALRTERSLLRWRTPRPHTRVPDGTPEQALERLARTGMTPVFRALLAIVDRRVLDMRWNDNNDRVWQARGRVGRFGGRPALHVRATTRRPIPIIGPMTQDLTVEARHCPIDYALPSAIGPLRCVGRRFAFSVGPLQSYVRALGRGVVVDYCLEEDGEQTILTERSWVLRGTTRAFPPIFSSEQITEWVTRFARDTAREVSDLLLEHAGLQRETYTPEINLEDAPASAPPRVTGVVPEECEASIVAATRRYAELARYVQSPDGLPWNHDIDGALHSWMARLPAPLLRSLVYFDATRGEAVAEALRLGALLHERLPSLARELNGSVMGIEPFQRGESLYSVAMLRVRRSPERRTPEQRPTTYQLSVRPSGVFAGHSFPPDTGVHAPQIRVCRAEGGEGTAPAMERSCSILHFQRAPRIEHVASVVDRIDGLGALELRLGAGGYSVEQHVRRALRWGGRTHCLPYVHPLRWPR